MCAQTADVGEAALPTGHRELAVVESIARAFSEASGPGELLDDVLHEVLDLLKADVAYVSVVDEESGRLKPVAFSEAKGEEAATEVAATRLGLALPSRVVESAQLEVVDDQSSDIDGLRTELKTLQLENYLGMPLKSSGRVVGVLSLFGAHPDLLESYGLSFVSSIAGPLGAAIENSMLREKLSSSQFRLRERVKELSILYDVTREALLAPSVRALLSFVARRLPASMQYQKAVAVVYCTIAGKEHLAWSDSIDETTAGKLRIVPGVGVLGALLVEKGVVLEYEISRLDAFWADCDVKSILAVPVRTNGEMIGSIGVYYLNEGWRFLREEEYLLSGISEQVAQYITRDAIERENRLHAREVSTLFEASKALSSVVRLEDLLPSIEGILVETLQPADAGVLMLFDKTTEMLTAKSAYGYDLNALSGLSLRLGESMTGKVFESGNPQVWATPAESASAMSNMAPHNRELFRRASGGLDHPSSAIGVPLTYRDEKIGVLTVETVYSEVGLSSLHLPFLQAFAELIVTNVKQIELLQRTERDRAVEEADRLKSELIAALAHDMRTPLTSIQGYASALLLEDVAWDEGARAAHLRTIEEEAKDLQGMIQDLLESSIIDAGLMTVDREPTLIPRLAEAVVDEMARRTAKHRFVISFPSEFPIVEADPRRLEQVLRNLLDNGVKYSPDGGLLVVRGQVADDEVILSVADNGIGIAPEHLNRLFEKFFRVKSPHGHEVRGTGLGLPVSRTIVESHGGRIWAESERGKGTTIYFTLPRGAPCGAEED